LLLGLLVVHDQLGWLLVEVDDDVVLGFVRQRHADGALDYRLLLNVAEGQDAVLIEPAHPDVDELLAFKMREQLVRLRREGHHHQNRHESEIPLDVHDSLHGYEVGLLSQLRISDYRCSRRSNTHILVLACRRLNICG